MDIRSLGLSDQDLEALGYRVSRREANGPARGPHGSTAPAARGDGAARSWLWTVVVLVAAGWLAHPEQRMPDPVPANQPDTVFSSARAMSQLVEIARAPRPPGSPEHDRVREYLSDRLRSLGLEVEIQTATVVVSDSGTATAATVRNVLGRLPGVASTGAVVLTAHYDGVPLSLAAGDDGVGLAAILETLRAIRRAPPLRNDLIVAITDGEELGSLGARVLLDEHTWSADAAVALGVDVRGVSGAAVLVESLQDNGALVEAFAGSVAAPAANSTLREFGLSRVGSDLGTFGEHGVPGLGFTSFGGQSAHHHPSDRPVNVSEATLQHHGAQLLSTTRTLGRADLTQASSLTGASRAYLSLPLIGVVHYPTGWSTFATVALFVGFAMLLLLFRVTGGRTKRALAGLGWATAIVAAGAAGGWALLQVLRGSHPEFGHVDGSVYDAGLHLTALVGLVAAVATGAYAIARHWLDRREVVLGALLVPLAAMVWMNVAAPYALVAIQPPLALALLAALPLVLLPTGRTPVGWVTAGLVALAAAALFAVVPGIEMMAGLETLEAAPWIGAVMAVAAVLVLPAFETLVRPKAWWTPALGLTAAAVAMVLAMPAVKGDARHPVPTSLVHLVDDTLIASAIPSAREVVAVGALPSESPAAARWMPGRWLTVPGVGEEWARSWVVGEAGTGSDPGPLLLPVTDRWVVAGTGAEAQIPLPSVRTLENVVEGRSRRVSLAIRPGLDAELIGLRLVDGVAARLTGVNGRSWDATGATPVRTLTHWGRPEGGEVTVDLQIDAAATRLAFDLLEHHLRPAEVLGENFFQREDSVVADASTGSDRVIQRVRVELPLS